MFPCRFAGEAAPPEEEKQQDGAAAQHRPDEGHIQELPGQKNSKNALKMGKDFLAEAHCTFFSSIFRLCTMKESLPFFPLPIPSARPIRIHFHPHSLSRGGKAEARAHFLAHPRKGERLFPGGGN